MASVEDVASWRARWEHHTVDMGVVVLTSVVITPHAHARARGYVIGHPFIYIYIYQFVTMKNTSSRIIGNYWLCR